MPHNILHRLRETLDDKCPVCGALPGRACNSSRLTPDEDQQLLLADMPAYLEFQILHAVHHLRNLQPDHVYVRALEGVLPAEDTKTQPLDFEAADSMIKCISCGGLYNMRDYEVCPICSGA